MTTTGIKKTLRPVSTQEFDEANEKWHPKMVKFAGNTIPFLDFDDKLQEARLVLYKCLQRFENGHGSIFHTYFHRALHNRAGVLAHRPLKHNENPNLVTYLGELDESDEEYRGHANVRKAIGVDFDPSVRFEMESWGFVDMEVDYVMGTVVNRLTLKETARVFDVGIDELKVAKKTATIKMTGLREVAAV